MKTGPAQDKSAGHGGTMGKDGFHTGDFLQYKKCPECYTKLPMNAQKCHSCNQKVGEIDKFGFAKKPFNWVGYGSALVLWIAFGYFFWWAFLKDQ
ncbi:MAG: hypothetical protein ACOZF0_15430 [Thermodesulfobacteriota bacterium]